VGDSNDESSKKENGSDNHASEPSRAPVGMQISSDEINFLVFRYLQEAGTFST